MLNFTINILFFHIFSKKIRICADKEIIDVLIPKKKVVWQKCICKSCAYIEQLSYFWLDICTQPYKSDKNESIETIKMY